MRRSIPIFILLLLCLALPAQNPVIRISTDETDLILQVANGGRLYQSYLGRRIRNDAEILELKWDEYAYGDALSRVHGGEAYSTEGNEDFFEPALGIIHNDGNRSTYLYYRSHDQQPVPGGVHTTVVLEDNAYPVTVKLHYVAYRRENVIKTWTEISHSEKKPVTLTGYASSMLYVRRPSYYLTEFSGDWAEEAGMTTEQLHFGKKVLETKQGSRAAQFCSPFFELGLGSAAEEESGEVLMGSIGWNGNFRFTFEVDNHNVLRIISGINPYASEYKLKPSELFRTPDFYFTLSGAGVGAGSRSFHRWARNYQVKDGNGDRMALLNNWENTYFDFDEPKLASIMKEASRLGVDLFLLDDGWFGNGQDARNGDKAGLGDWEVNSAKLPGGVPGLVRCAEDAGVKFGIWIEPEMVNPQSKLFRKHPDWALTNPRREPYYFRNQLVLDLSNPKVQDYVFGIVDALMEGNPNLAYFKWDCNSPITNKFSPYLGAEQSQMYVDHARGVYNVLERVSAKYPSLPMMLCSGGGARCDFETLRHFTEFWASDNTDAIERCYIQWGFSQFMPAKIICAHVTSSNTDPGVKFRVDVASMCKLGFDIGLKDLTESETDYCRMAISNWNRLKPVILEGDMYRLVSPYESDHMAVSYVGEGAGKAVLFVYDLFPRYTEEFPRVKLRGLDAAKIYLIREINLENGRKSGFDFDGRALSGDFLMNVGIPVTTGRHLSSHVFELTAE